MTKESIYWLQRIDCNCNDCGFMQRNIARYNTIFAEDHDNQYFFFRQKKARRIWEARKKIRKDPERGKFAMEDALALTFSYFPQSAGIQYGYCLKFNKEVSFIPNTLQLETQHCFIHRKDYVHK